MVKEVYPDKTKFIPHTLPGDIFNKLKPDNITQLKKELLGEDKVDHFVGIWVNRNAKRKRPNDLLVAWKKFIDKLQNEYGHKNAMLIMHTDPNDSEGPNLLASANMLDLVDNELSL
jgi:hypothetical protein